MKTTLKFCIASLFIGGFIYFCLQGPKGDGAASRSVGHGAGPVGSLLASEAVHVAASRLSFSEPVRDFHVVSGASLRAEPWLTDNGATVTVSWENIPSPSISEPFDWVGFYCPSGADGSAYLDYSFVGESPTHAEGRGSLKFVLYNLRTDCEFRYYKNSTLTTLLAVSNKVNFRGGKSEPLQGHLALTEDPTQMRVSWTTGNSTTPVVYYGLSRDNLTLSATGTSKTYTISDLCGPPANDSSFFVDPGSLHDVLLTNLKPKTMYYYKYGSGDSFSEVKNFTTAIVAGDTTPFKFIMYGDMGLSSPPGAETTAQLVLNEVLGGAAFVMHQGDLSYALGHAVKWDTWMNLIEPYASLAPYMISIGNHEYDHEVGGSKDPSHAGGEGFHPEWGNFVYDSAGECGVPPFYRFHMPDNGNSVFWYRYDYGLVHFTVISTEHDFTPGSPMYSWIEKDLQSVNRELTPWLIFVGHRPMYCSVKYPSDYRVAVGIQEALEDLFYEHSVDLAVWAHYHFYERTCAVYKQVCDPKGTVHIVVGSAGYELDDAGTYNVPWSIYHEINFGYLRVQVANASALHLEYVHNKDRIITDQVWLLKKPDVLRLHRSVTVNQY